MNEFRTYLTALLVALSLGMVAACAPTDERRGTGEVVDDAGLTARVKTALIKAEKVNATAINVNTYRGEVQLSGFVDSQDMAQRAVAAARSVQGVRTVRNDMRVAPPR
jgi:osmotically-inducible protein OsmY